MVGQGAQNLSYVMSIEDCSFSIGTRLCCGCCRSPESEQLEAQLWGGDQVEEKKPKHLSHRTPAAPEPDDRGNQQDVP